MTHDGRPIYASARSALPLLRRELRRRPRRALELVRGLGVSESPCVVAGADTPTATTMEPTTTPVPTAAPTISGYPMTNSNIRTAVDAWVANPTVAQAT